MLVATLRRMQAGAAQPYVLRSLLREQARKSIGAPPNPRVGLCTLVLDQRSSRPSEQSLECLVCMCRWEQNLRWELFSSMLRQPVEFFDAVKVER